MTDNKARRHFSSLLDESYLILLGRILSLWPEIEGGMSALFADIVGVPLAVGETMYFSVVNPQIRIKFMTNMITQAAGNKAKIDTHSPVLDMYGRLNSQRNKYVHGRWYQRGDGKVFLEEISHESFAVRWNKKRHVSVTELDLFVLRLSALSTFLDLRLYRKGGFQKFMLASGQIPPTLLDHMPFPKDAPST
jgi:hypothetical protein